MTKFCHAKKGVSEILLVPTYLFTLQLFMGFSSCTGPIVKKELQAISVISIEGGVHGNSSIFSAPQDGITLEYPCWEEYKVSA